MSRTPDKDAFRPEDIRPHMIKALAAAGEAMARIDDLAGACPSTAVALDTRSRLERVKVELDAIIRAWRDDLGP